MSQIVYDEVETLEIENQTLNEQCENLQTENNDILNEKNFYEEQITNLQEKLVTDNFVFFCISLL
jgi:FtsZ-binding cell division protein ZapB